MNIETLLKDSLAQMSFRTVGEFLKEKDPVAAKREEFKFIVPLEQLPTILTDLAEEFEYSLGEEGPFHKYETTYFDTPELEYFNAHRQGKYNRLKQRIRSYGIGMFLEQKQKVKGRFTVKSRTAVNEIKAPEGTQPQIQVNYRRLFLRSKTQSRRITVDFDLCAKCLEKGKEQELLPGHAILEIKQEGWPSNFMRQMRREHGLRPSSFSKYCVGMATLKPGLKTNKWKGWISFST